MDAIVPAVQVVGDEANKAVLDMRSSSGKMFLLNVAHIENDVYNICMNMHVYMCICMCKLFDELYKFL